MQDRKSFCLILELMLSHIYIGWFYSLIEYLCIDSRNDETINHRHEETMKVSDHFFAGCCFPKKKVIKISRVLFESSY
jgi:hypothetical protein